MRSVAVALCVVVLPLLVAGKDSLYKDLYNRAVSRTISVEDGIVLVDVNCLLENRGSRGVNHFFVALELDTAEEAWGVDATSNGVSLEVTRSDLALAGAGAVFRVDLASQLGEGATQEIVLSYDLVRAQTPFPAEIEQAEPQRVVVADNHFFFSPYATGTQSTVVHLSGAIESHSRLEPTSVEKSTITYGPYHDTPELAVSPLKLHFTNDVPILVVTQMTKAIEVSHWAGNVAVEFEFTVEHEGARLKKNLFSRFEYGRGAGRAVAAHTIVAMLPEGAKDVYYRDAIGNISSSHARVEDDGGVHMEFAPRFPLFGGWKTQSTIGYNLPSGNHLFLNEAGRYVLNISAAEVFDGIPIDELTIRVLLPEGSKDIAVSSEDLELSEAQHSTYATYLDTSGRPVVTFSARHLTATTAAFPVRVIYSLSSAALYTKPLLLIAFFFVLFLAAIAYQHMDLSINKFGIGKEARQFEDSLISLAQLQSDRARIFQQLEAALSAFVASRHGANFRERRQALFTELAGVAKGFDAVVEVLQSIAADYGAKAAAIQSKETERLDLVQQQHALYSRKVNKEVSDKVFEEQIAALETRITAAEETIDNLVDETLQS